MPSAVVLYHFLHPDDVVSAQLLTDLATGLQSRGWQVTSFPSNRTCHTTSGVAYAAEEHFEGVRFIRVWRPDLPQNSALGRVVNAAWMIAGWSFRAIKHRPDVLIIGTDPILSVLTAVVWKRFSPRTKIAHWCFDLYPEAAIADGLLKESSWIAKTLKTLAKRAYRSCDLIVDIGSCMRKLLESYDHRARVATITPWALKEPSEPAPIDAAERTALFGPDAQLGLLYSGSFGRAHIFEPFLRLARATRDLPIRLAFSVRGNREPHLRAAIGPDDTNVTMAPFVSADRLETRLAAADIHMVSLHEEWTGAVVPSKFFGALAVGRPVLFAGSPNSAIAEFIRTHEVGWILESDLSKVTKDLNDLFKHPERLKQLKLHCQQVYQQHFSKTLLCDRWDRALQNLIAAYHNSRIG